ncbi:MAG: nucleotidyltransferase domain-containing protein [Deinococcales bacterium]|nr:nucleotidyltransferase domain-containing protein [Chitinophagaceae bacterium]
MNKSILHILQQHKQALFNKYPIKSLALFGSQTREDYTDESDVDILVELNKVLGFRFLHLNYEIEDILQKKVDLISKKGLKPDFITAIENDLCYI